MDHERRRHDEHKACGPDATAPQDLDERLFEFAVAVVRIAQRLPRSFAGRHVGTQLLRSGTSAGANYEEARAAESKNDFVHKLQLSLKEMREARFWLRLIAASGLSQDDDITGLLDEATQLRAILSKAVATSKGKAKGRRISGARLTSWMLALLCPLLSSAYCLWAVGFTLVTSRFCLLTSDFPLLPFDVRLLL